MSKEITIQPGIGPDQTRGYPGTLPPKPGTGIPSSPPPPTPPSKPNQ